MNNGAKFNIGGRLYIGRYKADSGTMYVDGVGTEVVVHYGGFDDYGSIYLGRSGVDGTLELTNGASVKAGFVALGHTSGTSNNDIDAALNIYSGSTFYAEDQIYVGRGAHSSESTNNNGSINISGSGSSLETDDSIYIGHVDNGVVAFFRSDDTTYAGDISGSGDFLKAGGGTLTLTGNSTFGGTANIEAGTLTMDGNLGLGGLMTIFTGATVNGSGVVDRDVQINAGANLDLSNLIFNGVSTTSTVTSIGDFSTGVQTAAVGETLDVGNATGGTIDATAGTAQIDTLDGATVNGGNLGVSADTIESGTVISTGGVNVGTLNGGDISVGSGANVTAQQGDFNGSISG